MVVVVVAGLARVRGEGEGVGRGRGRWRLRILGVEREIKGVVMPGCLGEGGAGGGVGLVVWRSWGGGALAGG